MRFTISSLLTTCCMVALVILGVQWVLVKSKRPYSLPALGFILLFVGIHLMFPLEFSFSETIPEQISGYLISYGYLYNHSLSNVEIWPILIWISGAGIKGWKNIRQIQEGRRLQQYIAETGTKDTFQGVSFSYSSAISSPMVLFRKTIVLPQKKYEEKELQYILKHECLHISHHDFYWKQIVQWLSVLYWWFPFIYLFQKQVCLFLELRVDQQVTQTYSKEEAFEYMKELLNLEKEGQTPSLWNSYSIHSSFISIKNLQIRMQTMFSRMESSNRNRWIFSLLIFTLLSTFIVFEPYSPSLLYEARAITEGNTEIVNREGNSYLLINGTNMGIVERDEKSQEEP